MNAHPDQDAALQAPYLARLHAHWLRTEPARRWRDTDGTLVFFDVSGFTALTEKLAARSRGGGEELTDLLSLVFTGLLEAAEAYGGDTLKFGGDAILLLFEGDDHALRATTAAWDMQQVMRGHRRLRTSAGIVSLAASCGIASGPVHAFLAGSVFRELVFAGPTISAVVDQESVAESGQVLVAPSTAKHLPDGLLGQPIDGGGRPLLTRPQAAPSPPPSGAGVAPSGAAGGLDPGLVPYLRFTADGEHRRASVAFLQFRGLDALLAAEGPDAAWTALDRLMTAAQEACVRHGVTLLCSDCDSGAGKLMLAAGVPAAGTHDEDGLLLALGAMLDADCGLSLRAGANRGRVFAVHLGAAHRHTYTVMGETTNIAARVMGRSPAGGLLATDALTERLTTPFALAPVEPFQVKGVTEPVAAAVVDGLAEEERTEATHLALPVAGRVDELAALRAVALGAAGGVGGSVVLQGEAGIGKSRLLAEAVEAATEAGVTVLDIGGHPYDADRPYASLRRPLRELVAGRGASDEVVLAAVEQQLAAEDRRWLPLVGIPFGLGLPPTPEQKALSPQAARVRLQIELLPVLAAAIEGGLLLALEDAQWIDEASRELLTALLDAPAGRTVATVICTREPLPELEPAGALRFELGPLDDDAIEALLADDGERHRPLPPAVTRAIQERALGHPLFLEELLSAARAGRDIDDLPDSVDALITAHIDTFDPADRAILRDAAVLGMEFHAPLLAALAGHELPTLQRSLRRMEAFVHETDGRWEFRQALVRDAAYEALPYKVRRARHGAAATLIEQTSGYDLTDAVPRLSLHADAAGDHERSWRYSLSAADQAERQGAPVETAAALRRALTAGRRLPGITPSALIDVAQRLGDMSELAGLYDQADAAYRDARRMASGDPVRGAELCLRQGWLRERTGSYSDALRWYTRGLTAIEGRSGVTVSRLSGKLTLAYGAARLRQGRLVEAVEPLERAVSLAWQTDDRRSLAHASYLLDWAHTDLGDPKPALREQSLAIYTELEDWTGLANVLNNLGVNAFFAGDWHEAEALYERSREARRRGGDVVRYGEALHNVGELLVDQGRLDEAEPRLRRALAMWRGAGFPVGVGVALMNLGRAAARRGDDAEAAALLQEAHAALDAIGSEQSLDVAVREGEWHALFGRADAATRVLDAVRRETRRRGGATVLLAQIDRLAGAAAFQHGDPDRGWALLRSSMEAAGDVRYESALTTDLLARAARATGEPVDEEAEVEAHAALRGLGVVRIWPPPLEAVPDAPPEPVPGGEVTAHDHRPARRDQIRSVEIQPEPPPAA